MREYYMIIDQCIAPSKFLNPKYVPRIELANLALNEANMTLTVYQKVMPRASFDQLI